MYRGLVYLVAGLHHILAWTLMYALVVCWIYLPFWLAMVVAVTVVRIMTSRDRCIATDLEEELRTRANMKALNGFVGHYYVRPVRRFIKRLL